MSRMLAVCCLAVGVLAPSAAAATRSPMLDALSRARARHGLEPLHAAPGLDAVAASQSRRVLRRKAFVHGGRMSAPGFSSVGEAMALMRGWSSRPRAVVRLWLRSPHHRGLVLNPRFGSAGIGRARGRFGGRRATVWVVRFAGR
jgi:uncharacterized protein YkwD